MFEHLSAAFVIGLLGAGHCLGMCGGITAALSFAVAARSRAYKLSILALYSVGRILSYGVIGLLAGILGQVVQSHYQDFTSFPLLRGLAALMLVLMGCYVAGWWRILLKLEGVGAFLWRYIQPLGQRFFPVKTIKQALLAGMIWGWLPCGLVYSALAFALAQANPVSAAAVMLAFGAGTLPAIFLAGVGSQQLGAFLQKRLVRGLLGSMLIGFGVWTFVIAFQHSSHSDDVHSGHHSHHH